MTGEATLRDVPATGSVATRRLTFAVLALGVVTYSLVQSLLVPVLAEVQDRLDAGPVSVTWVLTGYLLSASISTPLIGRVGDAVGKKKMLVFSVGSLAVGSLLAAVAPNIGVMIAARVVQGMGGGVLPVSFGLLRDQYPAHRLGSAVSVLTSLTAAGFGCGVVLAGPIVDLLGYHWLFLLPAIATALGTLGALLWVPESRVRTPGGVPLLPALLLSGWLLSLLLAVTQGEAWGWSSLPVRTLLVAAVVLFAAWVRVERRVSVPLIDLAMMRRRGVWTCNAVALLMGCATFTSYGFLPRFLQEPESTGYGFGATVGEAGLMIVPTPLLSFLLGMCAASLVRRFSLRLVLCCGGVFTGAAFVLTALVHEHPHLIYLWTAVQGAGAGLSYSTLAAAVLLAVPAHQSGVASGMNANIRTIGGSMGTAVAAAVLAAHLGLGGHPTERGYTLVFLLIAGCFFLAACVALLVPSSPTAPAAVHDAAVASDGHPRPGGEAVP